MPYWALCSLNCLLDLLGEAHASRPPSALLGLCSGPPLLAVPLTSQARWTEMWLGKVEKQ